MPRRKIPRPVDPSDVNPRRKTPLKPIDVRGVRHGDAIVIADNTGAAQTIPYADALDVTGFGDVRGPGTAVTDNAIARWDGITGKKLQNSTAILQDDGRISTVTDPTLAQDAATKNYVDTHVPSGSLSTMPLPGQDGTDGEDGIPGPQGQAGATGATGPQGSQGVPGLMGADGNDGEDGIPGPQGQTGATGAQGIQGIQGLMGIFGDDGEDGDDGVPGIQGPQGPAGASGVLKESHIPLIELALEVAF